MYALDSNNFTPWNNDSYGNVYYQQEPQQVVFQKVSGEQFPLLVAPNSTVNAVKQSLASYVGIRADDQCLLYRRQLLQDHHVFPVEATDVVTVVALSPTLHATQGQRTTAPDATSGSTNANSSAVNPQLPSSSDKITVYITWKSAFEPLILRCKPSTTILELHTQLCASDMTITEGLSTNPFTYQLRQDTKLLVGDAPLQRYTTNGVCEIRLTPLKLLELPARTHSIGVQLQELQLFSDMAEDAIFFKISLCTGDQKVVSRTRTKSGNENVAVWTEYCGFEFNKHVNTASITIELCNGTSVIGCVALSTLDLNSRRCLSSWVSLTNEAGVEVGLVLLSIVYSIEQPPVDSITVRMCCNEGHKTKDCIAVISPDTQLSELQDLWETCSSSRCTLVHKGRLLTNSPDWIRRASLTDNSIIDVNISEEERSITPPLRYTRPHSPTPERGSRDNDNAYEILNSPPLDRAWSATLSDVNSMQVEKADTDTISNTRTEEEDYSTGYSLQFRRTNKSWQDTLGPPPPPHIHPPLNERPDSRPGSDLPRSNVGIRPNTRPVVRRGSQTGTDGMDGRPASRAGSDIPRTRQGHAVASPDNDSIPGKANTRPASRPGSDNPQYYSDHRKPPPSRASPEKPSPGGLETNLYCGPAPESPETAQIVKIVIQSCSLTRCMDSHWAVFLVDDEHHQIDQNVQTTTARMYNDNPVWDEAFYFIVPEMNSTLRATLRLVEQQTWDEALLCETSFSLSDIKPGEGSEQSVSLLDDSVVLSFLVQIASWEQAKDSLGWVVDPADQVDGYDSRSSTSHKSNTSNPDDIQPICTHIAKVVVQCCVFPKPMRAVVQVATSKNTLPHQTSEQEPSTNPTWNEEMYLPVKNLHEDSIRFIISDTDRGVHHFHSISVKDYIEGEEQDNEFHLPDVGTLMASIKTISIEDAQDLGWTLTAPPLDKKVTDLGILYSGIEVSPTANKSKASEKAKRPPQRFMDYRDEYQENERYLASELEPLKHEYAPLQDESSESGGRNDNNGSTVDTCTEQEDSDSFGEGHMYRDQFRYRTTSLSTTDSDNMEKERGPLTIGNIAMLPIDARLQRKKRANNRRAQPATITVKLITATFPQPRKTSVQIVTSENPNESKTPCAVSELTSTPIWDETFEFDVNDANTAEIHVVFQYHYILEPCDENVSAVDTVKVPILEYCKKSKNKPCCEVGWNNGTSVLKLSMSMKKKSRVSTEYSSSESTCSTTSSSCSDSECVIAECEGVHSGTVANLYKTAASLPGAILDFFVRFSNKIVASLPKLWDTYSVQIDGEQERQMNISGINKLVVAVISSCIVAVQQVREKVEVLLDNVEALMKLALPPGTSRELIEMIEHSREDFGGGETKELELQQAMVKFLKSLLTTRRVKRIGHQFLSAIQDLAKSKEEYVTQNSFMRYFYVGVAVALFEAMRFHLECHPKHKKKVQKRLRALEKHSTLNKMFDRYERKN